MAAISDRMVGQAAGAAGAALEARLLRALAIFSLAYAALVVMLASPVSFYTLDDPYIHLAVAENMVRGTFGVNLGEASNPSSSIVWPWLMAPFAPTGLLLWAPLLVNIVSFMLTARLLMGFVIRQLAPAGADPANALTFAGLGFFSFNLFGVVFTGLEHSLHVLVCVMAVTRALEWRFDWVMFAGLVLSPLVRFEGFAILALGLVAAGMERRWVFAAAALAVVAGVVGVWEVWLAAQGLPALPSSVLTKSGMTSSLVGGGAGLFGAIGATMWENLHLENFHMLALFAVIATWCAIRACGRERTIALGMLGFVLAVFVVGRIGWYWRYEVYALSVLGCFAIYLLREPLKLALASRASALLLGFGLVVVNFASGPMVALTTPMAARNIDRQQHQMHRFVAECWKRPVAINDLGWVALGNGAPVLDLAGLGSEAARKARASRDPQWMGKLMDANNVQLAMIYRSWFPELPADWTKVGEIVLLDPRVTPADATVTLYATRPQAIAPAQDCLAWLAGVAPAGTGVRIAR